MAVANDRNLDELYSFTTCDVLITDLTTGMELYSGKLKSHSISKTSTKTPIRAGIGGITWVELEDASEISIEIVNLEERLDMESLKLNGSMVIEEETIELTAFPKNYELIADTTNLAVELPADHEEIIARNAEIAVYVPDMEASVPSQFIKIEANKIVIDKAAGTGDAVVDALEANDIVMVGSYKYLQRDAKVIQIAADQVGTNVSVTLKQPLYGADRKVKAWRQYHFYRCSLGSEFTHESATEMAEQNTTTSFTVLKDPKHENLGYVAYVDVPPTYGTGNAPFRRKNRSKAKAQAKA